MSRAGVLVAVLAGLAGCDKQINPAWCELHAADPACSVLDARSFDIDAPGDGPGGDDRPPAMCSRDDDCPGTVCLPEGTCATEERSFFVSATGVGSACNRGARCSLATAIDEAVEGRDVILLEPGTYAGAIAINHPARIFGKGATLQAGAAGAAVTVTNGVAVELHDVVITGAVRGAGISCTSGRLHANRIAVQNNQQGITSGCELRVERSVISGNPDGAIAITDGAIDIRNNVIVGNGSPTLARSANVTIAAGATGNFTFNTVAFNDAKQNSTPGVDCQAAGLTVDGNLITDNTTRGKFDGGAQVSGPCDFARSYTAPGLGENDLQWVDPGALDFHLTERSTPALDIAGLRCDDEVDFDGEARPSNARCDYGADELVR